MHSSSFHWLMNKCIQWITDTLNSLCKRMLRPHRMSNLAGYIPVLLSSGKLLKILFQRPHPRPLKSGDANVRPRCGRWLAASEAPGSWELQPLPRSRWTEAESASYLDLQVIHMQIKVEKPCSGRCMQCCQHLLNHMHAKGQLHLFLNLLIWL